MSQLANNTYISVTFLLSTAPLSFIGRWFLWFHVPAATKTAMCQLQQRQLCASCNKDN